MKTKLSIAFSITVHHAYFKDGICEGVNISPGPLTQQLLKRFGFRYTVNKNVFAFFTNQPSRLRQLLDHISRTVGISYFDFKIDTNDPDFNFYTELPLNRTARLTYDTGERSNHFEKNVLRLEGKMVDDPMVDSIGSLKIHFDDILKYAATGGTNFGIRFDVRATQWQYFIIAKNDVHLPNPVIHEKDITFTGPEPVFIKTGQAALFFSSGKKLIPLMQYQVKRFSLTCAKEKGAALSQIIIKPLPCPRPSHFDLVEVGGAQRMASPMYVFI